MMLFNNKNQKKAEITLVEAVGLVLAAALILIIFTPIGNFVKDFIVYESPSEKALNFLGGNINNLIESPNKFDSVRSVIISIEDDYSIIGFDSEYESVKTTEFVSDNNVMHHYPEIFKLGDGKEIKKPTQCANSGCLCLVHKKKGIIDCYLYQKENLIISGIPFLDPDNSAFTSVFNYFSSLFKREQRGDLPMQNMGAQREKENLGFKDDLIKFGLNSDLFDQYGYLFLSNKAYYHQFASSPISWDVRSVYIEKMELGEYTFILLVPADSNYNDKEGYNLASQIIEKRVEVYNEITANYNNNLIKSIKEKNETKNYLDLFELCREYSGSFPSESLPSECRNIGVCSQSVTSSNLKCSVNKVPCVCMSMTKNEICDGDNNFCYLKSGCANSQITNEFECGW